MRSAVVDIGSTACRVVVAETTGGGGFRTVLDQQVVLGLGRAVRRGELGSGLLQLVEETVRRLATAAFRAGAERLTATADDELLRSVDGPQLRDRVAAALGVPVRGVAPTEAAADAARAVRQRLGWTEVPLLLEVTDHHLRVATAGPAQPCVTTVPTGLRDLLPAGVVDPLHPAAVSQVRGRLAGAVAQLPRATGTGSTSPVLLGSAGAALGRAAAGRRWGDDPPAVDGLRLSVAALGDLERELLGTDGASRMLLPGLDPAAVDQVAVTLLAVRAVVDHLGVDGVVVTTVGATEGRLLAAAGTGSAAPGRCPGDVREAAVAAVATPHGDHVAALVDQLVDALAEPLGLTPADRDRVVTAARLHELGRYGAGDARDQPPTRRVGGTAAHRRGAHALLTTGLPGVGPDELVELACLVRFQVGRLPGGHFVPYGRLPARRRRAVDRLTGLLRLACGLDVGEDGAVVAVHVDLDPDLLCVHALGHGGLDLALHGARQHLRAVEALLGTSVVVRAAAPLLPRSPAPSP